MIINYYLQIILIFYIHVLLKRVAQPRYPCYITGISTSTSITFDKLERVFESTISLIFVFSTWKE